MAKSKVVLNYKLEHTNKELDGRLTYRREAPGCFRRGWAGRPEPTGPGALCSSGLGPSPVRSCLLCCFVTACFTGLHLPNVLIHSFACIIAPSTWWFCFESPPCSLTSHASMIFLQNKALAAPACLSFACGFIKEVGGASHDASWCMHG
jgi:hypothetical protein